MLAAIASLLVLGAAGLAAFVVRTFLTEYASAGAMSVAAVAIGVIAAALLFLFLRKRPRTARCVLLLFLAVLVALPLSWLVWPGGFTYERFGLVVYGILPVPVLDVVITADGLPWFRDKTHRITRVEIERWLGDGVTDVVIGTGWRQVARVDPDAFAIAGAAVHVMSTPAAIGFYEQLRSDGRRVVLILHTTC